MVLAKGSKMRKLILLSTVIIMAAGISGCNTVEGVGRDIERAGESIQKM